ncbi:MAG: ATP synthase F1 subunit gamma [Candidatus Moraniibacteriota bacterium]
MPSGKDIRRRIKGVKSTGKITRAMEMISAVKMRRAVERALAMRPYAQAVLSVLHRVTVAVKHERHPLLLERPVKRELYVVITSNRGLCGSFNTQVLRKLREARAEDKDRSAAFITLGKKGEQAVRRMQGDIIASFPEVFEYPRVTDMQPIVRIILDEFLAGRVDRVVMVYTDYVSALVQRVKVRALLPATEKDAKKMLDEIGLETNGDMGGGDFLIEPFPETVLETIIPRLIEAELYHAVLESNASQEAARMVAMRSATDAAQEMTADLTLAYNQLRQGKITQEIAELSAGMAAVQG